MKIKEVNTNYILFDNGSRITFDHEQDCCETNYADFEQLEDLALEYEFENDLIFEVVPENGFRFGSKGTPMFFIPCYSDQNGYYSSDIDIFYDGRHVFNVDCEERIFQIFEKICMLTSIEQSLIYVIILGFHSGVVMYIKWQG